MKKLNKTAHKILDIAEHYTQTRGFNAFSYKDIQNDVGVKTSSIHYYFPTKQDLALVMTERFINRLQETLKELNQKYEKGTDRLATFNAEHVRIVEKGKFCLGGMLASDVAGLPELANGKLNTFFLLLETWLAETIALGQKQKEIKSTIIPASAAQMYLATLEGGMLIARAKQQPEHLDTIMREALHQLTV